MNRNDEHKYDEHKYSAYIAAMVLYCAYLCPA